MGSEILLGQISNRHAQTISRRFADEGFFLFHHSAVGDNTERIVTAFELASQRSNVIVVTGGLGPTVDDLTKESLAEYLHRPLQLSTEALATIERYFSSRNRPMPEANRKQALCIDGGKLLDNPNGTAPGQYVEADGVHYFLLPGPPLEMLPMLDAQVLPRLKQLFGGHKALVSRVLHFCGIGESDVDQQIADLTVGQNPTVAPLAGEGEMLLRITATATDHAEARRLIEPIEARLRLQFGPYIYGVDDETLPSTVGKAFISKPATLAVAESCTGGLLSAMLTDIPGASSYLLGGVIAYHNEVKETLLGVDSKTLATEGAVSHAVAKAMAQGVRKLCRSDFGIGITGIAGPAGGTPEKPVGLVFGAVVDPDDQVSVYRMLFHGSREQIRLRAAKSMLWRLLQRVRPDAAQQCK